MKAYKYISFLVVVVLACKVKTPEKLISNLTPFEFIQNTPCLQAGEVRENGLLVFKFGGAANAKPAYSKYKMKFNLPNNGIELTENDGTVVRGNWRVADKTIYITNINPPLIDGSTGTNTRTSTEYGIISYNQTLKEMIILWVTKNLKVGDVSVQYTLIPCK